MITAIQPKGLENRQNNSPVNFTARIDRSLISMDLAEQVFANSYGINNQVVNVHVKTKKFFSLFAKAFRKQSKILTDKQRFINNKKGIENLELKGKAQIEHSEDGGSFIIRFKDESGKETSIPVHAGELLRFNPDGTPKVKSYIRSIKNRAASAQKT